MMGQAPQGPEGPQVVDAKHPPVRASSSEARTGGNFVTTPLGLSALRFPTQTTYYKASYASRIIYKGGLNYRRW